MALIIFTPASIVSADNGLEVLRQTSKAFTEVAKKATPAVVSVQVEKVFEVDSEQGSPYGYHSPFDNEFFERFFGRKYHKNQPQQHRQVGQGSGTIITADGYIITNNHVVEGADRIKVTLSDGREFNDATIIGTDPDSDIAVIKIDGDDLPTIELGDSDDLEIGEWVIAVGNPFGLSETVTVGVVSAKGRHVGITEGGYEDFIQTDAAINPGNSGGPLLNLDGKAIGINSAIFSRSGGYMGIGFAIPVNMATKIKDQLIASGKVTRGYVGISMNPKGITPELAESFGLEKNAGVLIAEVLQDTPAERAGLKSGDIILKTDGKDVQDNISFRNYVALVKPGDKIKLIVLRGDKEKEITVKVGSKEDSLLAKGSSGIGQKLGLQVQELTGELAQRFGYETGTGVIVTEVLNNSSADDAGILPGMLIISVNRRDINSVKDFNDALKETEKSKKALLLVKYDHFAQYVVLKLE
jgi:serine protease Do